MADARKEKISLRNFHHVFHPRVFFCYQSTMNLNTFIVHTIYLLTFQGSKILHPGCRNYIGPNKHGRAFKCKHKSGTQVLLGVCLQWGRVVSCPQSGPSMNRAGKALRQISSTPPPYGNQCLRRISSFFSLPLNLCSLRLSHICACPQQQTRVSVHSTCQTSTIFYSSLWVLAHFEPCTPIYIRPEEGHSWSLAPHLAYQWPQLNTLPAKTTTIAAPEVRENELDCFNKAKRAHTYQGTNSFGVVIGLINILKHFQVDDFWIVVQKKKIPQAGKIHQLNLLTKFFTLHTI